MNQPGGSSPNVALLRQTMDAILANPQLHDQTWWATATDCGTAYCFAGWACVLSGSTITVSEGLEDYVDTENGEDLYIADVARERLGIDHVSADLLFASGNTTADLKHYVDQIAEHGRVVEQVQP